LLGFLPLYLLHRTQMWRLKRRILTLEGNQQTSTFPPPAAPPPAYTAMDTI
jgi:hypothetical protein